MNAAYPHPRWASDFLIDHPKPVAREGLVVVPKDIAGARFVSQGDGRMLERVAA